MRFSTRRLTILLAFSFVPLTGVLAQRGGMGGGGMGRGGMGGGPGGMDMSAPRFPSANDIKKFNPADLLLDKKKDLKLSEPQIAALTALRETITGRNAGILAQYDSLHRAYKPDARLPGPYGLDDDVKKQIKDLRTVIDSVNVRRLLDVTDALSVVTDDAPRHAAAALLVQQEEEYRKKLPIDRPEGRGGFGRN